MRSQASLWASIFCDKARWDKDKTLDPLVSLLSGNDIRLRGSEGTGLGWALHETYPPERARLAEVPRLERHKRGIVQRGGASGLDKLLSQSVASPLASCETRVALKTVINGIPAIGYPDSQPKETDTPASSRTAARSTTPRTVPAQPWPGRFGLLAGYSELSVLAIRAIIEHRIPSYEMASAFVSDRRQTIATPGLEARLVDHTTEDTGVRMQQDTYTRIADYIQDTYDSYEAARNANEHGS